MPENDALLIKKPVSILNRAVNFDFGSLLSAAISATIKGVKGDYLGIAPDLFKAGTSVRTESLKPGEIAWLLLTRSLARVVAELCSELVGRVKVHEDETGGFSKRIGDELDKLEIEIDRMVFGNS